MGTGKTTIGKALAKHMDWHFVDSDEEITRLAGQSIPDIFEAKGEGYFRQLEQEVIAEIMQGERQVVSSGGGSVLAEANRRSMMARGVVIALSATAETIIHRVKQDANRPLLQGDDLAKRVHKLLEERRNAYLFADVQIDTNKMTLEKGLALIQQKYNTFAHKG